MSLESTKHSKSWNVIPKKCKECAKAIYVLEKNNDILYQCSLYGNFKRNCKNNIKRKNSLQTPREIRGQ